MPVHYCIAVATWLCASASVLGAAQQSPVQTFRSGREILTIDTSVRDASGRPLTDLQPSDFTVRIDGETRRVFTARLFGADPVQPSAGDAAPVARFIRNTDRIPGRVVVFAIDRDSMRPGFERAILDTAAAMLDGLSPSDAVGALGIPGAATDLTRDRAAIKGAIRQMTGTAPREAEYPWSWEEALTLEGKCNRVPDPCPRTTEVPLREMLRLGRGHAQLVIAGLSGVFDRLKALSAPRSVVIISAGLPFDYELLPLYQELARKAAQSHVGLFVVHLDQPSFDASSNFPGRSLESAFGGREYASGLGTIASTTGGQFFNGVGAATGVFERIVSDIKYFYELGVESKASDADGTSHRVDVKVAREKVTVRAPAETAMTAAVRLSPVDAIKNALAAPTDVTELPLEVATYMTHSTDPEKVRVIVAAAVPPDAAITPSQWGSVIMSGAKVMGAVGNAVTGSPAAPWATTGTIDVAPGRYRVRTVIVDAAGRIGTLEVP